ncbi:hypothetical protein BOX15_Mlig009850g1 [Macrostomum lignano]|uniref:Uncharacterized protein n=1 Tax=Macrostomum lignano TaxID=282301 RepID=A0A267GV04_9PLAT|nr:hypothetical protein BOX15_Mlig009850g1 [Macrostomum lignano]
MSEVETEPKSSTVSQVDDFFVNVQIHFSQAFRDQFDLLVHGIYVEKITGNMSIQGFEVDRDRFGHNRFDVLVNDRIIFTRTLRPYLNTPRTDDVVRQVRNQYGGSPVFEIDRSN